MARTSRLVPDPPRESPCTGPRAMGGQQKRAACSPSSPAADTTPPRTHGRLAPQRNSHTAQLRSQAWSDVHADTHPAMTVPVSTPGSMAEWLQIRRRSKTQPRGPSRHHGLRALCLNVPPKGPSPGHAFIEGLATRSVRVSALFFAWVAGLALLFSG